MFDRAKRAATFSEENNDISPALYSPYPKHKTKACRVPFNCSAPAHALADNGVPAPCTYNIRYRKHRIKGCVSLRFTEPRNTFSHKPGPSPISYDPDLLYARKPKYQIKGKICRGKPPRFGCVPSISIPYKFFDGFDINRKLGLMLRPLRFSSRPNIEPIYHHFPYELNKTTLKYKGNQWSKLKSKRKFIYSGHPDSPGVGHYNLLNEPPKAWDIFLCKLKTYNVMAGYSLKWTDQFMRRVIQEDLPAPATYFIDYEQIYEHQSFNVEGTFSKAERFQYPQQITYQPSLNLTLPPSRTSTQMFWPPFNSSSFARPKIKETETSPAKYNVYNDTIFYNLIKDLLTKRVYACFNSLAKRETDFVLNKNPGPGTYNLLDKPKTIIYGARSRNSYVPPVKLTALRDYFQREITPWTYNINRAIKSIYKKRDFHKGPIWIKEKKSNRTKWAIKESPDTLFAFKGIGAQHNGQLVFNERPKKILETTPGPADYNVHPLFREACMRAFQTHNATSDLQRLPA